MTETAPTTAPARSTALDLLDAVLSKRRPLDDAIADHAGLARLEARDRGFARLLVATTLRRLGQIDAAIDHCLAKPLPAKARVTRQILRLGACQLLFLGTPPHAAVDSAVALAGSRTTRPFKGLVNALLRRLAGEGSTLIAAQDAARLNTPDWLWQRWTDAYGSVAARAIATAHLGEPPLDITVKDDDADWATRLDAVRLPTGTLRRPLGGPVTGLAGFDDGAWWIQDAAAALPARLLGDIAGMTVLDLCAAPGGKTAQLAAAGARVVALDRKHRLGRLRDNLARLGLDAETVAADLTQWRPERPAPRILLDAPCSATGTIRRHPDVARIKRVAEIGRFAALQERLLATALDALAPGGTLIYCVCSLEPEEGPAHIEALLARDDGIVREPITAGEVGGLAELIDARGDLRTLPSHLAEHGGLDGFYAARLMRVA
jgi:16S rRNA (cytosine967-C5)-methyltransferase